jgi:hypothetical protein
MTEEPDRYDINVRPEAYEQSYCPTTLPYIKQRPSRTTNRQAAKILIEKIIEKYGLHCVREGLAMHGTINA